MSKQPAESSVPISSHQYRAAQRQRAVERLAQLKQVLAVQDTGFLAYVHHPQAEGLGATGAKAGISSDSGCIPRSP